MRNFLLCMFSMVFLLSAPAMSNALPLVKLEAAVGAWNHTPSGELAYSSTGYATTLDFEDDFNYDSETKALVRAKLELPIIPDVYIMVAPMEFDETGDFSADFVFGDRTFSGTVPFTSKLQIDNYDVALYYGIPFLGLATIGKLNIDLGINVRIMDITTEIVQGTIPPESEDVSLPLPMLYAAVQAGPIAKFSIEAELRGVSISGNSAISAIGRIKFNILGPAFAAAGYRYDNLNIDEDDVDIDMTFSGPFMEAGFKF